MGEIAPGVYGIYKVSGHVQKVAASPNPGKRARPGNARNVQHNLPITITHDLMGKPMTKSELLQDLRFRTADIVNSPIHHDKNPFRLTEDQWQAVANRLSRRKR